MKQAITYSNKYAGVVDRQITQAITQFVSKRWQKAYDLFHFDNDKDEVNILAAFGRLYCAAKLEKDTAAEDAHILLNHTDFEFWPYLEEHNFPRYARRFAYQFLAYVEAKNQNYEDALNYVEEALYISSPIDDLDDVPLLEQKVQIYLATNENDLAYFTIQKLLRLDVDNDTFQEIINSDDYKNYLKNNDLDKLKKGTANETAKEALDRYERFIKIYIQDNDNYSFEELAPYYFKEVTELEIQEVENEFDFKFPPSYRNFILKNGLFRLGEYNYYESRLLEMTDIEALYFELEEQWEESFNSFKEGELDQTKQLITFSYGDESQQMVWYYYFDKRSLNPATGEMAVSEFSQDDWYDFDALPICEGNGFDKHISKLIDEQIDWLLD